MRFKLACLTLALSLSHAAAVVVSGPDGSINTTGAGAGDGWNYVGTVGGASGIYLGNYNGGYWVMTAAHVGAGNFTLNASTYNYVAGTAVQILNPDNTPTDLIVFQIATQPPSLPNLALADSTAFADEVVMVGNGRNREAALTTWYVDTGTSPNVWSATSTPQTDVTHDGYKWAAGNTKRWGDNSVAGTTTISYAVSGTTQFVRSLVTEFDNVDGEGQAAVGDSGGGLFHLNDNGTGSPLDDFWELSGVMVTIGSPYADQPGGTAIYGNVTYSVDIGYYKDAILSAVPEPGSLGLIALGTAALTLASRRGRRGGS
jgi:hypothetical protein